jgi:hypothetical protein
MMVLHMHTFKEPNWKIWFMYISVLLPVILVDFYMVVMRNLLQLVDLKRFSQ